MAYSVLVASQKGGVGKTMLAANIMAGLARAGWSIVGIDLDPQTQLTGHFRSTLDDKEPEPLSNYLFGETDSVENLMGQSSALPNGGLIYGSAKGLLQAGSSTTDFDFLANRLKSLIDSLPQDLVVIDSQPSLGGTTAIGLSAASGVVGVVTQGLATIPAMPLLKSACDEHRVQLLGVVCNQVDRRRKRVPEIMAQVMGDLPVFESALPMASEELLSFARGVPVSINSPSSPLSLALQGVITEIINATSLLGGS